MSRPLRPGLVAEGEADEMFLGPVIYRQLRRTVERYAGSVAEVKPTEAGGCRSIREFDRVVDTVLDLAADCDLIFVHNDCNERGKADRVAARLQGRPNQTPILPLVPVRETEAWLLADAAVWPGLAGADVHALPGCARDVEKLRDPEQDLARVVPSRAPRRRDFFDYIGRNIDLTALAHVPAYARWLADTEDILKELRYL